MHRQGMGLPRRNFHPRADRRVVQRGAYLAHAAAHARDELPVQNDLRRLKPVFLRPLPHGGVEGKFPLRRENGPVYPRRRQGDVPAPAPVLRIEIGRERRYFFRVPFQGGKRLSGGQGAGAQRDFGKPPFPALLPRTGGERRADVPKQPFPVAGGASLFRRIGKAGGGKLHLCVDGGAAGVGADEFRLFRLSFEKIPDFGSVASPFFRPRQNFPEIVRKTDLRARKRIPARGRGHDEDGISSFEKPPKQPFRPPFGHAADGYAVHRHPFWHPARLPLFRRRAYRIRRPRAFRTPAPLRRRREKRGGEKEKRTRQKGCETTLFQKSPHKRPRSMYPGKFRRRGQGRDHRKIYFTPIAASRASEG